ncbi:MAG: LysR family transcriptional regulator [Pseudomonadales bacterium]
MSLRALKTLIAIEQHGSFARAASALNLSQAAVSIQIKALEDELGCALFDRTARTPALNASGRKVLERAQQIVALYRSLPQCVSPGGDFAGEFSVGALRTVQQRLAPAIAALIKRHPQLRIRVVAGMTLELIAKVERGELDAALTADMGNRCASHCQWFPFSREPYYIVAPAELTGKDARSLLSEHPFIRFDRHTNAGRFIEAELTRANIRVSEAMQLDSLESALEMVKYSLGITVMPLRPSQREQLETQYALVPFGEPQLERELGLYQRTNSQRSAVAQLIVQQLTTIAAPINT